MLNLTDRNGAYLAPDQSTLDALDPATREAFAPVEAAARELESAESELSETVKAVERDVKALDAAEKFLAENYKPMTFHELHKMSTTFAERMGRK